MGSIRDLISGHRVDFAALDACLQALRDRWLVACHVLPNGQTGWYRRLNLADRIGLVATANAITAIQLSGGNVPHVEAVVHTLIAHRRPDGSWPFVSNLNDVGVVDSTSSVILALYEWQDAVEFRAMNLPLLLQGSLDWLEQAALEQGGWGMIQGSAYRNYSTALAIQALCNSGRRSSPVVQRAIQHLISVADPGTGGWHDAGRKLSLPTTCEVVRALAAAAADQSRYAAEINKACDWILKTGRHNELWTVSPAMACLEEVEVTVETRLVRIEYGHSPRPLALTALSVGGFANSPEAVAAMQVLLEDISTNRWEAIAGGGSSEPTSWMLYDVSVALATFRDAFSRHTISVWGNNNRVVEHLRGDTLLTRVLKEHWPKLAVTFGCIILLWALVRSGIIVGWGWVTLSLLGGTIGLNVISNFVSDFLRDHPWRK
jgi:hypothetical protein